MQKTDQQPAAQGLYHPRFEHDACGIGFIVNIEGIKSHHIIDQALTVLENLAHRGGAGSEDETGDGAGILLQIPDRFLRKSCASLDLILPPAGQYGVGMLFLPRQDLLRKQYEQQIERLVKQSGLKTLGWRTPPVNEAAIGRLARKAMPKIRQIFIAPDRTASDAQESAPQGGLNDSLALERKLFLLRKRCENWLAESDQADLVKDNAGFYFASLSSRTIVYKGMLTANQVDAFYIDLQSLDFESALALVHSRYSTNTFPSWERAHPYRYLIHNGEINTLRGNTNWMKARQAMLSSPLFEGDMRHALPVLSADGSDSAAFDNCLEFLSLSGRSLPHAAMMMVPEPWQHHESMSDQKKAFYEYHSHLMEPWDGPAAMAFTDGTVVGAILDRNGLRPSRYTITRDGLVILASETGVLDIAPENILRRDRLRPGRMLLIDTKARRIITDDELKERIAAQQPYRSWLNQHRVFLSDLPLPADSQFEPEAEKNRSEGLDDSSLNLARLEQLEKRFGYTYEDIKDILLPMARDGIEPLGSMGTDIPLAVLSEKPQLLYNYFKQLFAQVTNPPIDALRETLVTSAEITIGSEGNLIDPKPENCHRITLPDPLLSRDDFLRLKTCNQPGFKSAVLSIGFPAGSGGEGLKTALDHLFAAADQSIAAGVNILILTDQDLPDEETPIPALLACSGLHQHLIRQKTRSHLSLILESGEPREVHHFAALVGFGVSAIYPYLALRAIDQLLDMKLLEDLTAAKAKANYLKAGVKGMIKIISKMGISTIQSYQGAQIFEAIGLADSVIRQYFTETVSRIGGIDLHIIAREADMRHQQAYDLNNCDAGLDSGSTYQWRSKGEQHLFNPLSVYYLQQAVRTGEYEQFKTYSRLMNDETRRQNMLRGLLEFRPDTQAIPLEAVEPVDNLVKRFKTGAMSYGSISKEAHETLAIAMNRLGGRSNTGEGGEDPDRFITDEQGDSRCSAIKQIASGRFGVTSDYLVHANELQIKMAQGAKPGEGGQLPGRKVYPWVARTRHATPGVGLISPPPHHDIYSIEDLAELIHDLKNANEQARISVKLVSEAGVGTIAAGVAKGRADVVLISGYDGGTGASPISSIRHAGLPWELGLAETHQTLLLNDLRRKFNGRPEYVENFMRFIAQELREIMAELGFSSLNEMVGRSDLLRPVTDIKSWKAGQVDLSALLHQANVPDSVKRFGCETQDHGLVNGLDERVLLPLAQPALRHKQKIEIRLKINNTDRVTATRLGSEITRLHGANGLPEDTLSLHFTGSAGQSFAAFAPAGLTMQIEGDANDYLGKGLSGGKIIVRPHPKSQFVAEDNVIIGNVAFYGATSGQAFIRGAAGERFCVRNSGVDAVVEAVGDHGCEYMTGGRVVVLGSTGRNFAAGMSGGLAYVLDSDGHFKSRCNTDMVDLCPLDDPEEINALKLLIQKHVLYTGSTYAEAILASWPDITAKFVKIYPRDYRRMKHAIRQAEKLGFNGEDALMEAFNENHRDLSRISGS